MFKAVIFDMDGVIVDSEPLHIKAERKTLAPFDLNISDEEFHSYMGQTPRILLEGMIKKYSLDTAIDELYAVHIQNLLSLYKMEVEPILGALELISQLKEFGVSLALASSSDMNLIKVVMEKFELTGTFKAVTSGQELDRVKPFPDIFLKTSERLNTPPQECVVIEDSTSGIRAAKAAGMTCIGFRSPNSKNQNYSDADVIVDDLRSVDIKFLETLYEK